MKKIDYKILLEKYMKTICQDENHDYIYECIQSQQFTEEEINILKITAKKFAC